MKKLMLSILLISGGTSIANAWIYNTWCGTAVQTVPPDAITDENDRKEFYKDLNQIYCGSREPETSPGTPSTEPVDG